MRGTPRKEWYSSSPDSLKYLKRGWRLASSTATGRTCFGDQAGEALVEGHAQGADAAGMEAERGGEHEVGAIGLEQIGGADVGAETRGDQRDHVHERVGGLAAILREVRDLIQGQEPGSRPSLQEKCSSGNLRRESNCRWKTGCAPKTPSARQGRRANVIQKSCKCLKRMAEENRSRGKMNCSDDTTRANAFANCRGSAILDGAGSAQVVVHRKTGRAEYAVDAEGQRIGWRIMVLSLAGAVRRGSLR